MSVSTYGEVGGCYDYRRGAAWTGFALFHFLYLALWIGVEYRRRQGLLMKHSKSMVGQRSRRRSLMNGRNGLGGYDNAPSHVLKSMELTNVVSRKRRRESKMRLLGLAPEGGTLP